MATGAPIAAGTPAGGQAWTVVQVGIGGWLLLLAAALARTADVPSR